jgi:flagellar basal-body rod protein FlgF
MIRGLYAAGAGMIAEATRTDVTANNLANVSTAGFKKDVAIGKDFRSMMIRRINDGPERPAIGSLGVGAAIDQIATIHTQGEVRPTGNKYDLAIEGKGYFAVETPAGVRYTRNGNFTRSAQGELVTQDGYRVLGLGGAIQLGNPENRIDFVDDRRILMDDTETDTLRIVSFADDSRLVKEGANLFAAAPGQQEEVDDTSQVRSGFIELSNVNVVAEMVNLITGFRAYEITGKALQAHDSMLNKAVNEVGRV